MRERPAATPLVQPALVRNGLFVVLVAADTLANVGTCVHIVVTTIDLQDIRRLGPTAAGFALTVASLGLGVRAARRLADFSRGVPAPTHAP